MGVRKITGGLALIAIVAGSALAYRFWLEGTRIAPDRVLISGNIEVVDVQISFKIPGRVEKRPVDEGYIVKEGQVMAQLETADIEADLALREAELAAAKAALAALEAGSRPQEKDAARSAMERAKASLEELEHGSRRQDIAVAEAAVASAQADKERLGADLARATNLRERTQNAISQEDYDRVVAAHRVAVEKLNEAKQKLDLVKEGPRPEQIDQARAALAQAKAQDLLVQEGPRKEDIEQGLAKVRQAEAAVLAAKTRLSYATVTAPMPGVVLSKNIEPGEYVAPGTPVVTMANLNDIWLRGYISEGDHDRVKVGQRALVTLTTHSGKTYEGRVSFISQEAEFTPKTVQTVNEREKLVYRVKVDIDNKNWDLKPGMPADAEILVGEEK